MSKHNKRRKKTCAKTGQSQRKDGQLKPTSVVTITSESGQFVGDTCTFMPAILPPELWELIFKKLESAKDLLSCWNTCSVWASALRLTDFYFKMTLPFVLPYLKKNDLLKCSSVSKFWNATVDASIQEAEDALNYYDSSLDRAEGRIMLQLSSTNIPNFITKHNLSSNKLGKKVVAVNPVAFRFVSIWFYFHSYGQEGLGAGNRTNLLTCLHHYGHLIRHLHLSVSSAGVTFLDQLKVVRSCLKRTPNLRVLEISARSTRRYGFGEDDEINQELNAFHVYISENPFPQLEHLKALEICDFTNRKEYTFIAKVYAAQLQSLKFNCPLILNPYQPVANRFSSLQNIYFSFSPSSSGIEFEAFVRSSECPLKQLTLMFWQYPNELGWDYLTMAINSTSATLEKLIFSVDNTLTILSDTDISHFEQLRLPQLKLLQLAYFGYPSADFLKSVCPALQTLILEPYLYHGIGIDAVANCKMYSDLYSKHEFWNELTRIQRVKVDCVLSPRNVWVDGKRKGKKIMKRIPGGYARKIYTRSEYETKLKGRPALGVNAHTRANRPKRNNQHNVLITRSKNVYRRI